MESMDAETNTRTLSETSNRLPSSLGPLPERCVESMLMVSRPRSVSMSASSRQRWSADRFIPSRRNLDLDAAYYQMMSPMQRTASQSSKTETPVFTPSSLTKKEAESSNTGPGDITQQRRFACSTNGRCQQRILSFTPQFNNAASKDDHNGSCSPFHKKIKRHVPSSPERILDMPDIKDDFYSNVLDWSVHNYVTVALEDKAYCWNEVSGDCSVVQAGEEPCLISAIAWHPKGDYLAIGTTDGKYMLWDAATGKFPYTTVFPSCITVLTWCPVTLQLFLGSMCGSIYRSEYRTQHVESSSKPACAHLASAICSLRVSPDGRHLASGSQELLIIWNAVDMTEIQTIHAHKSAIKAIAWCPWQPRMIASGGGSGDGFIRLWTISCGQMLAEVDTHSQVCSLLWSPEHRELVSSHGQQSNDIILWKFPELEPVATLSRHNGRVLHLALSPDGKTLASVSSDETLMLWKCFDTPPTATTDFRKRSTSFSPSSPMMFNIR